MTHDADQVKGLRERRAMQTRAEIVDAGIGLFLEEGFDQTSMEEVAAAAGVSRRTVYRYFATKDDIVFDLPRQWLEVLNDVLADRQPEEPTRDLFRRGLLAVAAHIRDDATAVRAGYAVLAASESLASRHGRSDAEWVARYLEIIGPDVAGLEHGMLLAMSAAMALVGAQNALIAAWASGADQGDAVELMTVVLDQLDSVWPEPTRRPPART